MSKSEELAEFKKSLHAMMDEAQEMKKFGGLCMPQERLTL